MTNLSFQFLLSAIAICGIAFLHNRKWWILGGLLPVAVFYIGTYAPSSWGIEPDALFIIPLASRGITTTLQMLFSIQAPLWAIGVGLTTLVLGHISPQSIKEKSFKIGLCIAPLLVGLWFFRFLLLKGIDAI